MWLCPLSSFKWEDLAPDCDGFISDRCVDFRFVTRMLCPFLCSQQMGIQTLLHMQGQKVCGHRVGSVAQWCHQEPGSPSQPLRWPLGCSHGIHMVASDTIIADITPGQRKGHVGNRHTMVLVYHEQSLQEWKLLCLSHWVSGGWMWRPRTLLCTTVDFTNTAHLK